MNFISNVLAHLFFSNRSLNFNEGNCRLCSQLFVNDVNDFVSLIKYHFTSIFSSNDVFNKDSELLFTNANLMNFTQDVLHHFGTYYYTLVDSKQYRCMYFLVAEQSCELAVKLSKVGVRILINDIVSISNGLLIDGEYGMCSRKENRAWFLDTCVQSVKNFYFYTCKMLKTNAFVYMYDKFEPNVHNSANTLKIDYKPYLDYCTKKYSQQLCI